ncbi:MAG: hypothetical protein ABIJ56_17485 [Pseudomonadota bacterium]
MKKSKTTGYLQLASCTLQVALFLALPCLCLSCGSRGGDLKKDLSEIEKQIKNKDCAALYKYLSSARKQTVAEQQFVELCKKENEDIRRLLQSIKAVQKDKKDVEITYSATLELADGDSARLVFEDGAWKLDSDLIDFYPQSTPGEAIASFIKAFGKKRWDVLAQLMPSKYMSQDDAKILEKHWGDPLARAEMEKIIMVLGDHLEDEVVMEGNRGVLDFAPQHRVELLKERGKWVIVHIY